MRDGRALQAGTSHLLGQNFARAFDITYNSAEGNLEYCHTTSWGMSTRMIGGVVMTHGDDRGLILPPRLAPFQVVIVPIGATPTSSRSSSCAQFQRARRRGRTGPHRRASAALAGLQVQRVGAARRPLPSRDRPSGPRRRSGDPRLPAHRRQGGRRALPASPPRCPADWSLSNESCSKPARTFRDWPDRRVEELPILCRRRRRGLRLLAFHCGEASCEASIKERTTATPRCIPLDGPAEAGTCVACDRPSAYGKRLYFARAY